MNDKPTVGITIRLTIEERDALRQVADLEERPIQWVVRRLIREHVAQATADAKKPPASA